MSFRSFASTLTLALALMSGVHAAPGDLPHPEEAAVVRRIIERSGIAVEESAPASWTAASLTKELPTYGVDATGLKLHGIASKDKPQVALTFALNSAGRVVAIRGNGPWLTNDSFADLKAMTELRLLSVDHNGSTKGGPQNDYDGSGLAALADSKLAKIKLGLGFSDRGIAAAAQIKGLRSFHVFHSKSTEAGIDALAGHPALTDFLIGEMAGKRVTPAALAKIARIPKLTRVGFLECYVTYAGGLEHLKPLAGQLTEIDLSMCLVSAEDLELLKKDHPKAKVITSTPEQIAKTHKGVAQSLVRQAPPALADPLKAALAAGGK